MAQPHSQNLEIAVDGFFDPYKNGGTFDSPASVVFEITPDDDANISRGVKRIRVLNNSTDVAQLRIKPINGDDVVLSFPPQSLTWEDIRVLVVYETGTDPALSIHGYSD